MNKISLRFQEPNMEEKFLKETNSYSTSSLKLLICVIVTVFVALATVRTVISNVNNEPIEWKKLSIFLATISMFILIWVAYKCIPIFKYWVSGTLIVAIHFAIFIPHDIEKDLLIHKFTFNIAISFLISCSPLTYSWIQPSIAFLVS
jgi:hypothetical protein